MSRRRRGVRLLGILMGFIVVARFVLARCGGVMTCCFGMVFRCFHVRFFCHCVTSFRSRSPYTLDGTLTHGVIRLPRIFTPTSQRETLSVQLPSGTRPATQLRV